MAETLELARELIARTSVTPADAGCQALIAQRLGALGFEAERLRFGAVDNLWLRRGDAAPLFAFAGHTDVVPAGPSERWTSPPFEPQVRDGVLYGRGAADMKGGVAAMVTACEAFVAAHPRHRGSLALLLTSDEEGPALEGTRRVVETLSGRGERIDWCVVGEPSSNKVLGDTVKIGRRGSLTGRLRVLGRQGHVAYPERGDNPIHRLAPALAALIATTWDQGTEEFPPTSLQVVELRAGVGADNVVPGEVKLTFNFRYSPAVAAAELRERVRALLDAHDLRYELDWELSAEPFVTPAGELVAACQAAVRERAGIEPTLATTGGTSDARFVAPTGAQVIELGPLNASIHQIDEHVRIVDLELLSGIYVGILERLLT